MCMYMKKPLYIHVDSRTKFSFPCMCVFFVFFLEVGWGMEAVGLKSLSAVSLCFNIPPEFLEAAGCF